VIGRGGGGGDEKRPLSCAYMTACPRNNTMNPVDVVHTYNEERMIHEYGGLIADIALRPSEIARAPL
jgi:hypothetical protein